ncbi:MAG: acyl-CoA thioesterase [Planctomycetota bacterium]
MPDQACTIDVRVRYAETDPMGVLHHSRYAVFLEMGRTELLRENGVSYRDLEAAGVFFVVTRLEVRFRSPARYDDMLAVTTRVERARTARIDHAYTITERAGGRVVAEASTTLACVGADGRVRAIPADLLRRMDGPTSPTR